MNHLAEDILSLLLPTAAIATPLLVRVIRIQKRTIDALKIHVQVLSQYIEDSRRCAELRKSRRRGKNLAA